jgi:hypothetical protein
MNYIRDNNIAESPINWEFYKIFINLDKNKLPEITKYLEKHNKSDWNIYFENEFKSAFTSLQSFLCWKK